MVNSLNIEKGQLFVQKPGHIVSNMDGEKVMLSVEKGKYYNLGEIGGEIWDLLKEPISMADVVAVLQPQYDIDEVECREQVAAFLTQLQNEGLIESKV